MKRFFLYLLGYSIFVASKLNKKTSIKLYFKNFDENYNIFSSYNNQRSLTQMIELNTAHTLVDGYYLLGKVDAISLPHNKHIIIHKDVGFSKKKLAEISEYIISIADQYFEEKNNDDYFLMTLTPHNQELNIHGTAYKNGIIFSVNKKVEEEFIHKYLLHEYIHKWIGKEIDINKCKPDAANCYWWSEGFTEYLSLKILLENNYVNDSWFKDQLNQYFKSYYSSYARNFPNSSIVKYGVIDQEIGNLPYNRGVIAAFYMDKMIDIKSKNKYSIKNMILDMLTYFRKYGQISNEIIFEKILPKYLSSKEIAILRNFVIKGDNFLDITKVDKNIIKILLNGDETYEITQK